jgi:hypothetical protein
MPNTGVPTLPDDVREKLNNMCPAAAQLDLGDFLAAIKAMLEDHEATLGTYATTLAGLDTRLDAIDDPEDGALADLDTRLDGIDSTLADHESRIAALEPPEG